MRYLITITLLFNFQFIIAQAPTLSCISINNGDVQLSWTPPSDTCGPFNSYDIYAASSLFGPYILITSISNFWQTTYNDIGAGADTSSVYYYIVNNSGCTSNISDTIQADNEADNVLLLNVVIDSVSVTASGDVIITWIPSSLFEVNGYIIWRAGLFGGWNAIDTVYGRDTTFFTYTNSYAGDESESYNITIINHCGYSPVPSAPGHNTIYLSSSLDTCTGESTLEWNEYINWSGGVAGYNIYVSENLGPYSSLGTTTDTLFIHAGLLKTTTYCYLIRAIGSGLKTSSSNIACGFTDTVSNSGNTFLLTVEARDSMQNYLQWNEYGNWLGLVSSYNIHRSIDGGSYVLIDNRPFGTVSYTDSLEPLMDYRYGKGDFCYYIEPVKTPGDRYGCVDISNIVCVEQVPRFIVPNTFTPNGDGLNDEFKPVKVFIDKTDYLFIIYNRWGQNIFETNDFYKGWDGTDNGRRVPMGVYVYYFKFRINGDIPIEKTGTITLLR